MKKRIKEKARQRDEAALSLDSARSRPSWPMALDQSSTEIKLSDLISFNNERSYKISQKNLHMHRYQHDVGCLSRDRFKHMNFAKLQSSSCRDRGKLSCLRISLITLIALTSANLVLCNPLNSPEASAQVLIGTSTTNGQQHRPATMPADTKNIHSQNQTTSPSMNVSSFNYDQLKLPAQISISRDENQLDDQHNLDELMGTGVSSETIQKQLIPAQLANAQNLIQLIGQDKASLEPWNGAESSVDSVESLVAFDSKKKKKVMKKKKKMEKKHKEWKKGKKHKKKKYESKKKKGGMMKKKKGKKEKKKWGMEKKGHKKKGNFKKKKWGNKKKMKKGHKKGKKGHKMLKDKGHKKKGFKKVYHKEEYGKKKKWHDIKREKKWNTKQKKWKKKWHEEKGKKYKGKHMKKYHKKNKHGKKYKKEKKSKWKKHKGEKFKKGHKKKKEEYAKKKEGGKKKKMKKEMKKKKG